MTAARPTIHVERVARRFGDAAVLHDLSLDVRRSQIVSLIGPSGCGKSTLLRLIAGLDRSDAGRVEVDGRAITRPDRAVGFMFQEPRLLPWLTVRDNIVFGLPRAMRRHADERVGQLLAQVQLEGARALWPRQLSGGMAQRVALARCLAVEPSVVLLDEPFSAVDALTRMVLQELLLAIWQRTQLTLLLVTHDLDEALYLSDRVVVMLGRPAALAAEIAVDVPRPRDRRAPELAQLRGRLLEALHLTGVDEATRSTISASDT
ncbi:MAG TPA: ABC transporter ATP-binding protein [Kofleriaceae bacterium]|nr:ABC transporter ATP-binding protein [Kofleriaceae bacterium]